jgi:hypothetical protein
MSTLGDKLEQHPLSLVGMLELLLEVVKCGLVCDGLQICTNECTNMAAMRATVDVAGAFA